MTIYQVIVLLSIVTLAFGMYELWLGNSISGGITIALAVACLGGVYMLRVDLNRQTFSGAQEIDWIALLVMLIAAGCGAVANEYYRRTRPTFRALLRPIVITPITILPLYQLASMSPQSGNAIVLVALAAFQNGFFWRAILDGAKIARGTSK